VILAAVARDGDPPTNAVLSECYDGIVAGVHYADRVAEDRELDCLVALNRGVRGRWFHWLAGPTGGASPGERLACALRRGQPADGQAYRRFWAEAGVGPGRAGSVPFVAGFAVGALVQTGVE
jgi:hypothetical protein